MRSIAIDQPPARAVARITGEGTMTRVQFETFIANLEAAAPRTN